MKRILIVAGVVALVLATGTAGHAATPSSVAVSPTDTSDAWTGVSFLAGATLSPSACPASVDVTNTLCDHVSLDVGVAGGYWDTHTGGARVSISWASSSDNFDLYVYGSGGSLVGSSKASSSTSESVSLPSAAGGYEVRVVPVLVTSSGYSGKVTFSSQAIPSPTPTPSPTTSGGGGGSGSGSGGSGSGSGSGSGGSGGSTAGTGGTSTLQGPVAHYSFGSYGASAPGGLFYAPYPGSGSTSFNSTQGGTYGKVSYASAYGGPVSTSVADQVEKDAQARPIVSTIARTTWLLWLLLSLGVVLLAVVTYVIVEPEGDGDRVISVGETKTRLPVPPLALAGTLVRGLAAGGRALTAMSRRLHGHRRQS
jgi:hypothetical protein